MKCRRYPQQGAHQPPEDPMRIRSIRLFSAQTVFQMKHSCYVYTLCIDSSLHSWQSK
jgi:hypothetical protein